VKAAEETQGAGEGLSLLTQFYRLPDAGDSFNSVLAAWHPYYNVAERLWRYGMEYSESMSIAGGASSPLTGQDRFSSAGIRGSLLGSEKRPCAGRRLLGRVFFAEKKCEDGLPLIEQRIDDCSVATSTARNSLRILE
jgi:hypothetical protein